MAFISLRNIFDAIQWTYNGQANKVQLTGSIPQSYITPHFEFIPIENVDSVKSANQYGVFFTQDTKLYKSTDYGETKTEVLDVGVGNIVFSMLVPGAVGIAFAQKTNGTGIMYRTADYGDTWSVIDTSATGADIDPFYPPYYTGIANQATNWIFGEYRGGTFTADVRVFGAHVNDLAAWNVKITKASPGEVRHWHNVEYLYTPYERFVVTSGDLNAQLTWFQSPTSNGTGIWEQLTLTPTDQRVRVTKILMLGDKLIWGSDSTGDVTGGVWEGVYDPVAKTISSVNRLLYHNKTSLSIVKSGSLVLVSFFNEAVVDFAGYLYSSLDGGQTWCLESREPVDLSATIGGFSQIMGPDKAGYFYLQGKYLVSGVNVYRLSYKN